MTGLRKISYLFLLCFAMLVAGCGDDGAPSYQRQLQEGEGDVTLSLKVSIGNSTGIGSTRADFQPTENPYELIHTLRVIIMREDNTVEYNRMVNLPLNSAQSTVGDLKFKVSTSLGEMVRDENQQLTRNELKRIYLVANEASIPNDYVRKMLEDLKEGHYVEKAVTLPPAEGSESGEEETETITTEEYVPGDTFEPSKAAEILIYNEWTQPDETRKDTYAIPMVDNEGQDRKYVPMSEFFDISVSSNLTKPNDEDIQYHDLFITRNLVKFQFEIDSTDEMDSFRVTDITFNSLMQKEYLFPNNTVYRPNKYYSDGSVNLDDKEIIEYYTPGVANFDNKIRPYRFTPSNFGFNSPGCYSTYNPEIYFCESKTLVGDDENTGLSNFTISIGVEFDKPYPVLDEKGNPVLDEEGNPTYEHIRMDFDANPQKLDLPDMLPRNTVVKVKMTLKNGELSAVATVYPYTAVNLNPEFGFSAPETDKLTVAPTMELQLGGDDGLLFPTFTSTAGNTIQNLYWVSSNPSVVLLGNEVTNAGDQNYKEPSESIELPYLQNAQDPVPVRLIAKAEGTAIVTVYTQSGLVARCVVTVTK